MELRSIERDLAPWISRLAIDDLRWVLLGDKPGARFKVRRTDLGAITSLLHSYGLAATAGFEAIRVASGAAGREWGKFDRGGYSTTLESYLYVAADRRAAGEMREADERCDHVRFGAHLGYPACCVLAFAELAATPTLAINPAAFIYSHGLVTSWLLNIFLIERGITLVSHLPCGPTCRTTRERAERRLALLHEHDPAAACALADNLSGVVLHGQDGTVACLAVSGRMITRLIHLSTGAAPFLERMGGRELECAPEGTRIGQMLLPRQDYQCYRFR